MTVSPWGYGSSFELIGRMILELPAGLVGCSYGSSSCFLLFGLWFCFSSDCLSVFTFSLRPMSDGPPSPGEWSSEGTQRGRRLPRRGRNREERKGVNGWKAGGLRMKDETTGERAMALKEPTNNRHKAQAELVTLPRPRKARPYVTSASATGVAKRRAWRGSCHGFAHEP